MMLEEEYRARQQNEAQQYLDMFVSRLDIEEDLAMALVEMGFTSLEEIAYVPAETFDEIELDAELVELLQSRAKEAALTDALKQQENIQEPSADLLTMEGMTSEIAYRLPLAVLLLSTIWQIRLLTISLILKDLVMKSRSIDHESSRIMV